MFWKLPPPTSPFTSLFFPFTFLKTSVPVFLSLFAMDSLIMSSRASSLSPSPSPSITAPFLTPTFSLFLPSNAEEMSTECSEPEKSSSAGPMEKPVDSEAEGPLSEGSDRFLLETMADSAAYWPYPAHARHPQSKFGLCHTH